MNNRTIAITVGVVGGLVGLGVLAYYLINDEKDTSILDEKIPETDNDTPTSKMSVQKPVPKKRVITQQANKTAKVIPITAATLKKTEEIKVATPIADEFPLKLGSKGERVERLRVWLMRNYGWTGIINDEFDSKTNDLVMKYLKKSEVDEDTYYRLKIGKPVYEQTLKR